MSANMISWVALVPGLPGPTIVRERSGPEMSGRGAICSRTTTRALRRRPRHPPRDP